jgi:hypothetical protein
MGGFGVGGRIIGDSKMKTLEAWECNCKKKGEKL